MKNKLDEVISKSLDAIETSVTLSKSVLPSEVSDDVPSPGEQPPVAEEDEKEPEEPVEEEQEEGVEEPPVDEDEDVEKSMRQGDNVRKALEVSDFLEGLVSNITSVLSSQKDSINKSINATNESQELLVKSFEGMAKAQVAVLELQTELAKSVKAIADRMDAMEKSPVVRKSISSPQSLQVLEKSFQGNKGTKVAQESLTKSQALVKLTDLCKSDSSFVQDVLALESTGNLNALSDNAKSALGLQ